MRARVFDFGSYDNGLPAFTDGQFYRTSGQAELRVDDWFYMRDNDNQVTIRFNTDESAIYLHNDGSGSDRSVIDHHQYGRFDGANGFNFGQRGIHIENDNGESGGFHADGDNADIWSPGDGSRLLRIWDEDGMNERAYVDGGGRVYSDLGFSTFSDMRLKKNIATIDGALGKIMTMRGVNYDMRDEILMKGEIEEGKDFDAEALKNQSGFIAQELLEVYPEVVTYDEEKGYYAVQYDGVIPVLVEAMKEQQNQIEALKAGGSATELDELKAEIDELKMMLNKVLESKK
jgi:hypothetical protein